MAQETHKPIASNLWRTLGILLLVSLALRLLVFGTIAHEPRKFYTYDSDGYDRRAMNLLHYGTLASEAAPPLTPDLDRTPTYPLYLAAVWGVVGHQPWVTALLQLVLGSLTAVFVYLFARELRLPHLAALLAGLIVALDPVSAMNANRILTETLFTMLIVAAVWLLARYWNTLALRWALLSALLLGAAALTRPISQFLPVVLLPLFVVVLRRVGWRRTLAGAAIFAVVSLGLTYSWAYRNYRETGLFTLSTISDTNLIYYRARAVLADVDHISQDEAWARLEKQVKDTAAAEHLSAAETIGLERKIAIDIFRTHPVETLLMTAKGAGRIFGDPGYTITCTLLNRNSTAFECFPGKSSMNEPGLIGKALDKVGNWSPLQIGMLLWSVVLLAAVYLGSLVGAVAMLRERRWLALGLLLLLVAYFIGLAAGAESNSRFRVPALPFIAVFAGFGGQLVLNWLRTRRSVPAESAQPPLVAEQV